MNFRVTPVGVPLSAGAAARRLAQRGECVGGCGVPGAEISSDAGTIAVPGGGVLFSLLWAAGGPVPVVAGRLQRFSAVNIRLIVYIWYTIARFCQSPSLAETSWFTAFGLALPPVAFMTFFAKQLGAQTHRRVSVAKPGEIIRKNHVYVAPGDGHLVWEIVPESL